MSRKCQKIYFNLSGIQQPFKRRKHVSRFVLRAAILHECQNYLAGRVREGLERLRLRPVIMFFIKFQKIVNWRSKLFVESGYEVLTVVCVAGEECEKN